MKFATIWLVGKTLQDQLLAVVAQFPRDSTQHWLLLYYTGNAACSFFDLFRGIFLVGASLQFIYS